MLLPVQLDGEFVSLLRFIVLVLSYFVNDNYCTVVYYDTELTNDQHGCDQYCHFLQAIEKATINEIKLPVVWVAADSRKDRSHIENVIELGCQSYIIVTRSVKIFLELKLMIKETSVQRIRDKNFLIFSQNDTYLDGLTRESLKFYPNLWFMIPSEDAVYDFYTQEYYVNDAIHVQLVDRFNISENEFNGSGNLFYDKLFDLQGRTIPMGVAEYAPYCMTTNVGVNNGNADAFNSSFQKELYVEGLEGSLIVEFCRNRNCNIELWPYGPSDWGDIFANGSGYGEIYSTYTKQTEFSICCLYYNWYLHLLDGSQYVAKSTITILVPGAKLLPTSLTLIYPFAKTLWLAILIMLILLTTVHHLVTWLNQKHSFDTSAVQPPIEKRFVVILRLSSV